MRVNLLLFLAVLLAFLSAVLFGFVKQGSGQVEGLLLLVSGLCAVVFSKRLTEAQHELAEKSFVPRSWATTRPLLYVLWGSGVAMLGILQLFSL
jgi:hypothetical protein